jgi:hypothetical protein
MVFILTVSAVSPKLDASGHLNPDHHFQFVLRGESGVALSGATPLSFPGAGSAGHRSGCAIGKKTLVGKSKTARHSNFRSLRRAAPFRTKNELYFPPSRQYCHRGNRKSDKPLRVTAYENLTLQPFLANLFYAKSRIFGSSFKKFAGLSENQGGFEEFDGKIGVATGKFFSTVGNFGSI